VAHPNVLKIVGKVIRVFNLAITYGDFFLASPQQYDELYFEIIRSQGIIERFASMGA